VLANEDVGRQIAIIGQYERLDARYLSSQVRPTDVCVDVGANTGFYTMMMAAASPLGSVHAFEPDPLNWHLLCAGVAINAFSNVRPNNVAVGRVAGTASFSISTDGAYSSLIPTGRKPEARTANVPVESLDGYLERTGTTGVDIMKVDVEGAEKLVVEGARGLLTAADRRPRVVLLELYDRNLGSFGTHISEVVDLMQECEYMPFYASRRGGLVPFTEADHNRAYNVFFLPATSR
jgi:FkbM family methyltransferase